MRLVDLAAASRDVARTPGRLAKVGRLAACLRALAPDEVAQGVAYLMGELPQGRIGIGGAALRAARQPPAHEPRLTLADLDEELSQIAATRGAGSASARAQRIAALFAACTELEQDFLAALLAGELRQGALEGVMLDAIAQAFAVPVAALRRAVMLAGGATPVARAIAARGAAALSEFALTPFHPIQPMLAQSAADAGDAVARLGRAALEWKLDGARIQVHRVGSDVRVFTRQGNDVTAAVPEIVEAAQLLPVRSAVLDGEAIALREDGRPQPFQVTMRRFGRRLDDESLRAALPLRPFFFDCMHLDGQDLLASDTSVRHAALAAVAPDTVRLARIETDAKDEADAFLAAALRAGHEGLMAKALDAPYEAGRRGAAWLKVKPTHTLDLVVLAAEWGSGRRRGWLSNLHLGARDPNEGGLVMLGKTFKGLTDEMLRWQTERLSALAIARDAHVVHVRPELVVEIAFDGVQESPHYPGGLALRFARVKRHRPDKAACDADTIDTVRALFAAHPTR
ncbi:MAG: ATP-dependent DNA ligase [Proteobacteria bacterium]|nr:MAG: ATP-dependent DNA ligase [Pseudomonadota bacterium]